MTLVLGFALDSCHKLVRLRNLSCILLQKTCVVTHKQSCEPCQLGTHDYINDGQNSIMFTTVSVMAAAMIAGYVCVVPSPEPWIVMECDIGIVYKLVQL